MFSTILVPLDGSVTAEEAIPFATRLAEAHGSRLLLVRAARSPWDLTPEVFPVLDVVAHERKHCQDYLDSWVDKVSAAGVPVESWVLEAESPARMICEKAQQAKVDLIVMSSHGRMGWQRFLLGSVTENVARMATCPVMIVKPGRGAE